MNQLESCRISFTEIIREVILVYFERGVQVFLPNNLNITHTISMTQFAAYCDELMIPYFFSAFPQIFCLFLKWMTVPSARYKSETKISTKIQEQYLFSVNNAFFPIQFIKFSWQIQCIVNSYHTDFWYAYLKHILFFKK